MGRSVRGHCSVGFGESVYGVLGLGIVRFEVQGFADGHVIAIDSRKWQEPYLKKLPGISMLVLVVFRMTGCLEALEP